MIVYLVMRETDQGNYTEGRYWSSAEPDRDVLHVYSTKELAQRKIDELRKEFDSDWEEIDDEEEDNPYTDFYIKEMEVEDK